MASEEPVRIVLTALKCTGVHPFDDNKYTRIINTTFMVTSLVIVTILAVLEPILHMEGLDTLVGALESISGYQQVFLKVVAYLINRKKIQKLLIEIKEEFWPINKFDKKLEKELANIETKVLIGLKLFAVVLICTILSEYVKPIVSEKRVLSLQIYNLMDLNYNPYYIVVNIVQIYICAIGAPILLGFDGFFVYVISVVGCQLKMVKHAIQNLNVKDIKNQEDEEECFNALKTYIKHHIKILLFFENIKLVYSIPILIQLLLSIVTFCGALSFVVIEGSNDYERSIKCICIFLVFFIQIAFYCTAGQWIIDISSSVGDGAYESDWWCQPLPRMRKALLNIIIRSQRELKLSPGGLVNLDLSTLTSVLRTSFSFVTLLKTVNNEQSEFP